MSNRYYIVLGVYKNRPDEWEPMEIITRTHKNIPLVLAPHNVNIIIEFYWISGALDATIKFDVSIEFTQSL